ncbi:MAG TPA: hypothetical protein VFG23_17195 [Polyangia bacterium]|nr:hypothetical protein [Polyangia bacterium]
MSGRPLAVATAIGIVLQVAMVIAGHLDPAIKAAYAIGGTGFSLIAGWIYPRMARGRWGPALAGGAIAGGAGAFVGIALSAALKDVPVSLLALGRIASVAAGLVGGALARALPAGSRARA